MRKDPSQDWYPAIHEGIKPPGGTREECEALYKRVIAELENEGKITTENYSLLLQLENKISG